MWTPQSNAQDMEKGESQTKERKRGVWNQLQYDIIRRHNVMEWENLLSCQQNQDWVMKWIMSQYVTEWQSYIHALTRSNYCGKESCWRVTFVNIAHVSICIGFTINLHQGTINCIWSALMSSELYWFASFCLYLQ